MRPVIGITSAPREARTPVGYMPHETVSEAYVQSLVEAGAAAVILPVHGVSADDVVSRLDGIALTGGGDIDPSLYGRTPRPETEGVDPTRDRFETDLIRMAVERDMPLLAICRGIQMLNVALGGTLFQDVGSEVGTDIKHMDEERWKEHSHRVRLESDSIVGGIIGEEVEVNSLHHQAVDRPAPDLRAVGWSPDGLVEAVEAPGLRFCVGLQWHPEYLGAEHRSFGVIESFVRSAREARG